MIDGARAKGSVLHYFVDEAGDPTLFSGKGKPRNLAAREGPKKRFSSEKVADLRA